MFGQKGRDAVFIIPCVVIIIGVNFLLGIHIGANSIEPKIVTKEVTKIVVIQANKSPVQNVVESLRVVSEKIDRGEFTTLEAALSDIRKLNGQMSVDRGFCDLIRDRLYNEYKDGKLKTLGDLSLMLKLLVKEFRSG